MIPFEILIAVLVIVGSALGLVIVLFARGLLSPKRISTLRDLVRTGKSAPAIKMAKHLIAKDNRNSEAHYFLGLAYLLESKAELALMEFKTVNNIGLFIGSLDEAEFRRKMAELYLRFGQDEEALKEYILLVKLDPYDAESYYQCGLLFEGRHRSDQAAKYFRKTLELNPRHSNSHLHLGLIYYRAKHLNEAKQSLEQALRMSVDNYSAHYYLGKILKESNDINGALAAFERSLKDPDYKMKALVERGALFIAQKNYERAAAELERAIKLSTDDGDKETLFARYFLALCYEKNRQMELAIAEWEKIYAKKATFKDVAEKLQAYADLRSDDHIKDYVTSNKADFTILCQKLAGVLGYAVRDQMDIPNGLQLICVENESEKWRNVKKMPKIVQFHRGSNALDDSILRGLVEEVRKLGANRAILLTNVGFTRTAQAFAENRPFELIGKEALQEMLRKVEF